MRNVPHFFLGLWACPVFYMAMSLNAIPRILRAVLNNIRCSTVKLFWSRRYYQLRIIQNTVTISSVASPTISPAMQIFPVH